MKSLEKKAKSAKDLPGDVTSADEPSDESDGSSSCSAPALKEKKMKAPKGKPKGLAKGKAKAKAKAKGKAVAKSKVVKLSKLCAGLAGAGALGSPGPLGGAAPGGGGAGAAAAGPAGAGLAAAGPGGGGHGGGAGGAVGPHAKPGDNFIERWGPFVFHHHKSGGVTARWKKEDRLVE